MKASLTSLRDVPGFVKYPDSDCRYVEGKSASSFGTYFRQLCVFDSSNVPKEGGMVNEQVEISLPTGESFFCISYRGDLDGWRSKIEDYARVSGARYGRIEGDLIVLSDGGSADLGSCEIVQH